MIHFERTHMIDAAPDAVWAVLGRYMHIDEFAPLIASVDALPTGQDRVGSKGRNVFDNGTSVVEEVTSWTPGEGFTVELSDIAAMPLHEASSEVRITPVGGRSKVTWTFDCRVKFRPLGWLMGQTMMMRKIIDGNLKGLESRVQSGQRA